MQAIEAFLEILHRTGVRHLFGNPGTTELPLNEALTRDDRFQYVLGLHEIPVMAMADGYAMASGQVAVVNLHSACGLGNAMGMLYNAWCEGTPLLVTAGQQDRRLRWSQPVLEGDLVRAAEPWTKWAAELQRAEDLPVAVRRAIQTALTPPTGPVFLSLPVDLQRQELSSWDLQAPWTPSRRLCPDQRQLERAAALLANARNPAILAGSRVTEAEATDALARLADCLQAPVLAENTTSHGRLPIRPDHPLYEGILPYWSSKIRDQLSSYDCLLAVGLNLFRLYIYETPDRPLPDHLSLVQLDNDPREISKNFPVDVGLWGDPLTGLEHLARLIERQWEANGKKPGELQRRGERHRRRIARKRQELAAQIQKSRGQLPMSAWELMGTLAEVLPPEAAVVEEAITTHHNVLEGLGAIRCPEAHFAHRGWALGWGLGCALGVKLAWPDRPVVALLGDGAALYGIQGLWTAAQLQLPVVFVIAKNRRYKILEVCGKVMDLPSVAAAEAPGLKLEEPAIDYVQLARAFGVRGRRVDNQQQLSDGLREGLGGDAPLLLEAAIDS